MARPLLRSCEVRQRVECYFNPEEQEIIRNRAREAGLPLSSFIRKAALGTRITSMPTANVQIWKSLSHAANNLNQIAHHLNSGKAYGVHPDVIDELAKQVQQLRLQLLGASE